MKAIKPKEELLVQLKEMEKKKQYTTMNANMKSMFVGYSRAGIPPSYFLRADYFKDQNEGRLPAEYWQVPNPEDPYFVDRRRQMQNYKDLIEVEDKMGIKSSNKFYLTNMKKRHDFLFQPRKISQVELDERFANERIQLIIRDEK